MYDNLRKDREKTLYPGCTNFTRLSAVLRLFNLKAKNGWTDKSFTELLELLKEMLPEGNTLPNRNYEAKKILCPMGMEYKKIHACPNDCILYRNEFEELKRCPRCGLSRYKVKDNDSNCDEGIQQPPAKVLWYLPIIPRLKRLFNNVDDAKNIRWHADERKCDGYIRHPADSLQWKKINALYPEFGNEPRNLRLGLATDGMNPFGNLSSIHSSWPVLLIIYNLPPSICMKRKYIMLSMMISGPKQPGNEIDVYLGPLIEDLRMLWEEGVRVFDAHSRDYFTLRAMLFCTINDFPAYVNLCGYSVKGHLACPICEKDTKFQQLRNGKKTVYLRHRRFLRRNHPYRRLKKAFNGHPENEIAPKALTGEQVYDKVKDVSVIFGKGQKQTTEKNIWKKRSVFFNLPYWSSLDVRHCIDVMHVEKNVCDSVTGTLLNIKGKTKDGVNARLDMVELCMREELAPHSAVGKRRYLPPACYTLSKNEKKSFCDCLQGIKVPQGYSSNFKSLVSSNDLKLVGLKSHDCHILMQQLLPVAIRDILPKKVRDVLTRLSLFFNAICSKVIDPNKLDELENEAAIILCHLPVDEEDIPDECELYVDNKHHIVAYANVYNLGPTIHNQLLDNDMARVAITKVLDPNVHVPRPTNEVTKVGEVLHNFIQWPKRLLCLVANKDDDGNKKDVVPSKRSEPDKTCAEKLMLKIMSRKDDVKFKLEGDAFFSLPIRDIMELCLKTQDLRVSILRIWVVYMKHLCTRLDKTKMYGFIDPNFIQPQNDRVSSQSHITEKLVENEKNCFFVPYLNNHHWQLLITEPKTQNVIFLCSMWLKPDKNIVLIVDSAINGYNMLKGSRKHRKPTWKTTLTCQRQTFTHESGYYVMIHMLNIVSAGIVNSWNQVFGDSTPFHEDEVSNIQERLANSILEFV